MKHIKHVVCLAAGIMLLTAANAPASTVAATDAKAQTSSGTVQAAQSTAALVSIVQSVLGNATGANKLTTVAVPEPTTMVLTGLGGASLLLFRRQRKQSK
ncbi:MAG TPA: PEP-CTERM sorting domain-containing protein [Verrucomicrobiae bacterium]|nr:PEP-CTERM sorting domain-containing protein [Verrucomicrobiae bacterium]